MSEELRILYEIQGAAKSDAEIELVKNATISALKELGFSPVSSNTDTTPIQQDGKSVERTFKAQMVFRKSVEESETWHDEAHRNVARGRN